MKISRSHLRRIIREELLREGPRDEGIFKAIFMAGCPGSGKGSVIGFVLNNVPTLAANSMKIVNQDAALDRYLAASGLMGYQQDFTSEQQSAAGKLGARARKNITGWHGVTPERQGLDPEEFGLKPGRSLSKKSTQEFYVDGRLGLIIDGTAASLGKTLEQKAILEKLGYETMMIAVNVPREESVRRNRERGLADPPGRGLADIAVERTCWRLFGGINPDKPEAPPTPSLIPQYMAAFGEDRFVEIDNTKPRGTAVTSEDIQKINRFIQGPLSATAEDWILQNL